MKASVKNRKQPAVLLIDGHCLLCSRITRFAVKRDKGKSFQFTSLQSEAGQALLLKVKLSLDDIDTFVMVQDGQYYMKSNAALRIFRMLGGLWPLLYILIIVPSAWRNRIYDWIAMNRYRWFGRSEVCILPFPEVKHEE